MEYIDIQIYKKNYDYHIIIMIITIMIIQCTNLQK